MMQYGKPTSAIQTECMKLGQGYRVIKKGEDFLFKRLIEKGAEFEPKDISTLCNRDMLLISERDMPDFLQAYKMNVAVEGKSNEGSAQIPLYGFANSAGLLLSNVAKMIFPVDDGSKVYVLDVDKLQKKQGTNRYVSTDPSVSKREFDIGSATLDSILMKLNPDVSENNTLSARRTMQQKTYLPAVSPQKKSIENLPISNTKGQA